MKKYKIIHNFTATATIEVLADSREEAFEKARNNELDLADYEFELDNAEIGSEEDIPELPILISQAESIIKDAEEREIDFALNPWPRITTEYWDGNRMEHHQDLMYNIYFDHETDEIGFNTINSAGDFNLSEIPDTEQLDICLAIINQAENNGIKL